MGCERRKGITTLTRLPTTVFNELGLKSGWCHSPSKRSSDIVYNALIGVVSPSELGVVLLNKPPCQTNLAPTILDGQSPMFHEKGGFIFFSSLNNIKRFIAR